MHQNDYIKESIQVCYKEVNNEITGLYKNEFKYNDTRVYL